MNQIRIEHGLKFSIESLFGIHDDVHDHIQNHHKDWNDQNRSPPDKDFLIKPKLQ